MSINMQKQSWHSLIDIITSVLRRQERLLY